MASSEAFSRSDPTVDSASDGCDASSTRPPPSDCLTSIILHVSVHGTACYMMHHHDGRQLQIRFRLDREPSQGKVTKTERSAQCPVNSIHGVHMMQTP